MAASQRIGSNYSPWWGTETQVDEGGNEIEGPPPPSTPPAGLRTPGEINTQRTSTRAAAPCGETGTTASGDSIYVAGAAVKGRDARTGVEMEVFSASAQGGGQFEVQVGGARMGASSDDGTHSIGIEVFTARAAAGVHNADGSMGWNAGVTAVAVGAEGTASFGSASSLTAGASLGVGFEGSIGLRDVDGDQEPELCARAVVGWGTIGLCVEMPFTAPSLAPAKRDAGR